MTAKCQGGAGTWTISPPSTVWYGLTDVAALQDGVGVWFDEIAALPAAEQCSWRERIGVAECVPGIELFLKWPAPTGAAERSVEGIVTCCFPSQDVFVPFD